MRKTLVSALLALAASTALAGTPVAGSKHDLSVAGPGPVRAATEARVCIFCHVAHGGGPGMTSRPDAGDRGRPYESSTMQNRVATPTGTTRMCLSCHDGTIAVGQTRKGRIEMRGTEGDGRIPSSRASNVGTDLRRTHPVSFAPASSSRTSSVRAHLPRAREVRLDARGEVQCTSCHDPHSEFGGTPEGKFLVRRTANSELCATCHDTSPLSAHASATAQFGPAEGNTGGYQNVADAGCRACHQPHGADENGRLLAKRSVETGDALCLRCHQGRVAPANISTDWSKRSTHAVDPQQHDASEGPSDPRHRLPEMSAGAPRHATCVDCHDPHQANDVQTAAPAVQGVLAGVWGIDRSGRRVDPARFEYEVCFKCHADSLNRRSGSRTSLRPAIPRTYDGSNLRRAFGDTAVSFHPVVSPGRNPLVPSLVPPYSAASFVYCSDCHASDSGKGAGGAGARGPHGSIYPSLLERNYTTGDLIPESASAYALCYKCHSRDLLLSDRSAFRYHAVHVVKSQTPCSVCHVAHGVEGAGANAANNARLVDFDLSVVRAGSSAQRRFEARAPGSGSCTLVCHGKTHDRASY